MAILTLAERSLVDGSQTVITLVRDTDENVSIVTARNCNGESSATIYDDHEGAGSIALEMFNHPFSKVEWLDYPTAANRKGGTVTDYAEAITAEWSVSA